MLGYLVLISATKSALSSSTKILSEINYYMIKTDLC